MGVKKKRGGPLTPVRSNSSSNIQKGIGETRSKLSLWSSSKKSNPKKETESEEDSSSSLNPVKNTLKGVERYMGCLSTRIKKGLYGGPSGPWKKQTRHVIPTKIVKQDFETIMTPEAKEIIETMRRLTRPIRKGLMEILNTSHNVILCRSRMDVSQRSRVSTTAKAGLSSRTASELDVHKCLEQTKGEKSRWFSLTQFLKKIHSQSFFSGRHYQHGSVTRKRLGKCEHDVSSFKHEWRRRKSARSKEDSRESSQSSASVWRNRVWKLPREFG